MFSAGDFDIRLPPSRERGKSPYLLAESIGWSESLALAARTVNESIVAESTDYIVNHLKSHSLLRPKICLLGLAFKGIPETNDLRGSVSIKLFKELKSKLPNSQLSAFDITIENSDLANLDLTLEDSIENAFQNKDAVLIINNHPIFNRMNVGSLSMRMNQNALIYDYWGRFDQITNFSTNVAYSSWGSHCFSKELK